MKKKNNWFIIMENKYLDIKYLIKLKFVRNFIYKCMILIIYVYIYRYIYLFFNFVILECSDYFVLIKFG